MHLPEQRTVQDGEQDGDEQQEEDRGPADPREGNEGREEAARTVLVAPAELRPEGLCTTGSGSAGSRRVSLGRDVRRRWLRRQSRGRTG